MKKYKKLVLGIIFIAMIACIGLAVFFLKDSVPKENDKNIDEEQQIGENVSGTVTPTISVTPTETLPDNVLRDESVPRGNAYANRTYWVLGSQFARREITSITFLDTLENVPANHWDASYEKNGKVLAWTEENGEFYDLYIAGEGGVYAKDCKDLFSGYVNLKSINFNNCFFTEYAESMSGMFGYCNDLTTLNLECFDTRNVKSMEEMFMNCERLEEIIWGEKNTENVTSMYGMFYWCFDLRKMDLQEFETHNVISMKDMFRKCTKLREVNISGLDARKVKDVSYMFYDCWSLSELNYSGFLTEDVKYWDNVLVGCDDLTPDDIDGFCRNLILSESDSGSVVN